MGGTSHTRSREPRASQRRKVAMDGYSAKTFADAMPKESCFRVGTYWHAQSYLPQNARLASIKPPPHGPSLLKSNTLDLAGALVEGPHGFRQRPSMSTPS